MKHCYNYDKETKEFVSEELANLDPAETELQGKKVFLLPAHATFVPPPISEDGKIQVFNEATKKWSVRSDLRGTKYYDPTDGTEGEITKIGKRLPKGFTTEMPDPDIREPKWKGGKWVESCPLFYGKRADTKERLNKVVTRKIAELGEEKAKTLFLISISKGEEWCPEWDTFCEKRQAILDEADAFEGRI
jgi:hypothetical protein